MSKVKPFFPLRLETIRDLAIAVTELARRFNLHLEDVADDEETSGGSGSGSGSGSGGSGGSGGSSGGGFDLSDIPDVTHLEHGLAPVSPGDPTTFLNGDFAPAYVQVKDSDLSVSDVPSNNVSSAAHGFAPKLPNDPSKFLDGQGNYKSARSSRVTANIVTAVIADGASELSVAPVDGKTNSLLLIAADRKCRVRLYSTAAARDNDAARLETTRPTAGIGLLAEFVFDVAGSIPVSPVATLTNDEAVPVAQVAYNVTNKSGLAAAVTTTLTILPLEI